MEALKNVRAGNVVMPHGEILGTTKVFPYRVDIYFAESMRGSHPQFRESKSNTISYTMVPSADTLLGSPICFNGRGDGSR